MTSINDVVHAYTARVNAGKARADGGVMLITVADLCSVPHGESIIDANGVRLTMDNTDRPTTNLNWISWVRADGVRVHTDQVALPAAVAS